MVDDAIRLLDATLVDPASTSIQSRSLLMAGGRLILDDGRRCRTLSARGSFILPGLIDMHVHLVPAVGSARRLTDDVIATCVNELRSSLRAGVTAVRDVGGPLDVLLAVRRYERDVGSDLSRVFVAGPMLSYPGGHGLSSGHGMPIGDANSARSAVLALVASGVDLVKLVTSGARGDVQMPLDVLKSAINAALVAGSKVAVHAHLQVEQIAAAVEAGATSIEHGFYLHRLPDAVARMAASNVSLCPTLTVIDFIRADPAWFGQRLVPAAWEDALTSVRRALAAGVRIVAGTDCGVFGVVPGHLWREIDLISECGRSRWDGLKAATSAAATVLGRADLGSLMPGSVADLVVLRRNPVENAVGVDDVVGVFKNGASAFGEFLPAVAAP